MTTVTTIPDSAQGSEGATRSQNVLPIAGFVQIPLALLPTFFSLSRLAKDAYVVLVARCDGWTRRGRSIPRVKVDDVAATLGASYRRTALAIAECKRAGLVATAGDPRDPRGCQYVISKPSSFEAGGSELDPRAWKPADQSSTPSCDPPASMLASDTLLRSRSENTASPRAPARAPTRVRARGAGGRAVCDDLAMEVLELFAEPRWYRHGAAYVLRKLEPLRGLGTKEQIVTFVRAQLRDPKVRAANYPPALACDPDGFAGWLELERRRCERAKTIASSPVSTTATATAAPRRERRAGAAALERAAQIARLK